MAASVYLGKGAHDGAAAKLIVEEAGGKATDVFGDDQRYDEPIRGVILSNGKVHDPLVDLAGQYRS